MCISMAVRTPLGRLRAVLFLNDCSGSEVSPVAGAEERIREPPLDGGGQGPQLGTPPLVLRPLAGGTADTGHGQGQDGQGHGERFRRVFMPAGHGPSS